MPFIITTYNNVFRCYKFQFKIKSLSELKEYEECYLARRVTLWLSMAIRNVFKDKIQQCFNSDAIHYVRFFAQL